MSQELYIVGGLAVTMNSNWDIVKDAVIGIRAGKIFEIKSQKDFKAPAGAQVLDATHTLVLPGLVNGHTHIGMTLLRGMTEDLPVHDWLTKVIFPAERKWGTPEFVYFGAKLACAEMIKSGTTTLNDMYYFEEAAARAVHEVGMRGILGQTVVEISQVQDSSNLLRDFDAYLEAVSGYPLVIPAIAPHSVYGVTEKTWRTLIGFAEKRGLRMHLHLSETEREVRECREQTGMSPPAYCESLGLFELPTISAHGAVLSDEDRKLMGKYRAGVVHNPESNMKLATQICRVKELREAGVPVSIGTDGSASNNNLDLFQEIDTAAKLQTYQSGVGALKACDAVSLLTREGARALHLEDMLGSLEVGKAADLIALDLNHPHAAPLYDPYSHVVYAASGSDVRHTVVAGKVLMENRRLTTLDEKALIEEARSWGARIAAGREDDLGAHCHEPL